MAAENAIALFIFLLAARIYSFLRGGSMKAKHMIWIGLACALGAAAPALVHAQTKPVVLRFVSDFQGPPHPAGMAMKHFGDRLPQVIPGSEARLYYAGAL